ncbi:MAG TPA: hypothetical protein DGR97_06040 [Gammaproteobacteria bacterium]|nr:hypothetical protein [Gammaproteobacteria bacterium]|tara:strand:- start:1556 stop:2182 length:627 start_codon:yes stop_codon:yes gene_type:complete
MNKQRHMLLALGLLVSIVASIAVFVWLPLMESVKSSRERISYLNERVAQTEELKSTQQQLRNTLAQLQNSTDAGNSNQFVAAKSPILGAATLQRRIKQTIAANNARQISSQPLSSPEENGLHKLQVAVSFSGNLRALHNILYELETVDPEIFIDQLLIAKKPTRRARGPQRQGATSDLSHMKDSLSVRLLATAYMQLNETSDAQSTIR